MTKNQLMMISCMGLSQRSQEVLSFKTVLNEAIANCQEQKKDVDH
jgi:hypothetical protein